MGHLVGKSRKQVEFLCLEELIEADSPARQIDEFVDGADTSYFEKAALKVMGRPSYNPKDMLKLYIHGMDNGIRSSRKLDRECKVNVEAMWLMNGLQPDDKTICNFRKDNVENIKRFFNEHCVTLARAGYIEGKIMGNDGVKIRANNSKKNNFSGKKLDERIKYIEEKIAGYLNEMDKNDKADEVKEKEEKIEELKARKKKYETFKERIDSGEVTEVSTTDPDARIMRQGNGGSDVSYNTGVAVDGKNKLIAGFLVTNEANDQGKLYDTIKPIKDRLGLEEIIVPADKGFYDTDDFKKCEDAGIIPIVAKPEKEEEGTGLYKKGDFKYITGEDVFVCPAGQKLKGSNPDENGYKRYRNPKACAHCPLRDKCTTGKRKDLGRHQYADYAERNDQRLKDNPEIYKLRQQLCEHPFGTMKRTMGIRQFLLREKPDVSAEVALICLAYNLKRLRVIHKNGNRKDGAACVFACFAVILLVFHLLALLCSPHRKKLSA